MYFDVVEPVFYIYSNWCGETRFIISTVTESTIGLIS